MPQIDWSKVPSVDSTSKIDWDKIPDQTYTPPTSNVMRQHENSLPNWFEDLKNDVKHGGTSTLPGRALHALGVQGIESGHGGGEGGVGDIIGGELLGPAEIGHAGSRLLDEIGSDGSIIKPVNELIRGIGHTAALPGMVAAPELIPQVVPSVASFGTLGAGASKTASVLGADPDQAELTGNIAMIGAPGAKNLLGPSGRFLERNAPALGKAAGYGGAAAELYHTKNPMSLILGSPSATKIATKGIDAVGRAGQAVGDAPLFSHELFQTPEAPEAAIPPAKEPLQLGRGAIITPPPQEQAGPIARPAASQVIRGKGGRMTKQFLTSEAPEGGKVQMGSQPPLIQGFGEPQAPPPVDPQFAAQETVNPQDNNLIQIPKFNEPVQLPAERINQPNKVVQTESVSNENLSDIEPQEDLDNARMNPEDEAINNRDLIDTRGLQQDMRENLDRGQESADELGRKIFYKNNKVDVGKTTGEQYRPELPGEDGNTDLLPWAQTPWGSNKGAISNLGTFQTKVKDLISPEMIDNLNNPEWMGQEDDPDRITGEPMTTGEGISRYRDRFSQGQRVEPIELGRDNIINDGLHRTLGAYQAGVDEIPSRRSENPIQTQPQGNDWPKILSEGMAKAKAGDPHPFAGADEFEGDLLYSAAEYLKELGNDPDTVDNTKDADVYKEAVTKGWNPADGISPSLDMIKDLPDNLPVAGEVKSPTPKPKKKSKKQ